MINAVNTSQQQNSFRIDTTTKRGRRRQLGNAFHHSELTYHYGTPRGALVPRGPNVGVVLAPQRLDQRRWWHLVRGWAQWPVMCRMSHYLACVILTGVRTTVGIPSLIDMLGGPWVFAYGSRSTADEMLMFCEITSFCYVTCWGVGRDLRKGHGTKMGEGW